MEVAKDGALVFFKGDRELELVVVEELGMAGAFSLSFFGVRDSVCVADIVETGAEKIFTGVNLPKEEGTLFSEALFGGTDTFLGIHADFIKDPNNS